MVELKLTHADLNALIEAVWWAGAQNDPPPTAEMLAAEEKIESYFKSIGFLPKHLSRSGGRWGHWVPPDHAEK